MRRTERSRGSRAPERQHEFRTDVKERRVRDNWRMLQRAANKECQYWEKGGQRP